jgi:hypothetical protein
MSKVIVSVLLAAAMVGAIVVGVSMGSESDSADVASQISPSLSALRGEVAASRDEMRSEIAALSDSVRSLRDALDRMARDSRSVPVPAISAISENGEPVPSMSSADLRGFVASVLDEQERVKDENRERERQEARALSEERKREVAALSEGPYDRYNLKINSLGNVLSMSDAQKQGYFELTTAYREKVEQKMKELREERTKDSEASEGESRDRRRESGGRGDRDSYRDAFNGIQEEFTTEMQQLLSVNQFATYSELSRDARSVFDRDQVFAAGEERSSRSNGSWGGGRSSGGRSSGGRGGGRGR